MIGEIWSSNTRAITLKTNADTQEKEMVGTAWANISGNLFWLAVKRDDFGRDIAAQLRHLLPN